MRHRENTHLQLRGYSMVSGEFQNVTNLKIASCSFSCKNTNVFFGWVKVFFFSRKQNQDNCNPYFIGLNNQSKVVFKKYDNEKNASSNIQHEEKKNVKSMKKNRTIMNSSNIIMAPIAAFLSFFQNYFFVSNLKRFLGVCNFALPVCATPPSVS